MNMASEREQRGKGEGGKKPPSRIIKQVFKTFENVLKTAQRGENTCFDTLKHPAGWQGVFLFVIKICAVEFL